jgi:hypothetical protein
MSDSLSTLDSFSARFGQELFGLYPQWREFARAEPVEGSVKCCLIVEVPPPSGADIQHPLWISTERDEVTVGLDHYHMHFDWPAREQVWSVDPMLFIAALLAEEVVVVSHWHGEQWTGSNSGEWQQQVDVSPGVRARVRSWNGRRNRDITG